MADIIKNIRINGRTYEVGGSSDLNDFGITATAEELNKLDGVTATTEELNYVNGVTSNIQGQLNSKQPNALYTPPNVGTNGYVALAQLEIKGTQCAQPIIFNIVGRDTTDLYRVVLRFRSIADGIDPDVLSITYSGAIDNRIFIHKTDISKWILYYKKPQAWDNVSLLNIKALPKYKNGPTILITHPDILITEKPTENVIDAVLADVNAKQYVARIGNADTAAYATMRATTAGTEIIYGKGDLVAGNNIPFGEIGNAEGRILLFGTNTGYTMLTVNNNTTSNCTLSLPNKNGILALKEDTVATNTGALTYYIDSTNGSDTNDGSENEPFKTIQHAIDILPKYLSYPVTIQLTADRDYDEDVIISGFTGDSLLIVGGASATEREKYRIKTLQVRNSTARIAVVGITYYGLYKYNVDKNLSTSVYIQYSNNVALTWSALTAETDQAGILIENLGRLYLGEILLSNKGRGLVSSTGSNITCYNISGSGNTTGLAATLGGQIYTSSLPTTFATSLYASSGGGSIFHGENIIVTP